uniref:Neurturin n=2 Tax=Anser cygnoides TaxID=8845 RepID=A0A8B9EUW4_ANSCY
GEREAAGGTATGIGPAAQPGTGRRRARAGRRSRPVPNPPPAAGRRRWPSFPPRRPPSSRAVPSRAVLCSSRAVPEPSRARAEPSQSEPCRSEPKRAEPCRAVPCRAFSWRPPVPRVSRSRHGAAAESCAPARRPDSSLFESYTEGEIRQLISALVERYSQAMNSGGHELPLFPKAGNRMKRARARHKPCALKELEVSVSELGLGYESDETVLFRYCSGTCDAAVRNYDLSLKSVRSKRRIRKEKVRARPCCRPLSYDDDVSFLDAYNRYYTVNELSAKECGCV